MHKLLVLYNEPTESRAFPEILPGGALTASKQNVRREGNALVVRLEGVTSRKDALPLHLRSRIRERGCIDSLRLGLRKGNLSPVTYQTMLPVASPCCISR